MCNVLALKFPTLIYIYMVVRSFQSSNCVVFLSYWRDMSKHVVIDLMFSSFFCLSFLFCYNMMGVRDLLYRRLSWV